MSLEGRETPGGAIRPGTVGEGTQGPNPEGAAKPEEAAGRSSDRADGRMAEYLVVVKTTRRERQTNEPLRLPERFERRAKPREGRPRDGDVPVEQPR